MENMHLAEAYFAEEKHLVVANMHLVEAYFGEVAYSLAYFVVTVVAAQSPVVLIPIWGILEDMKIVYSNFVIVQGRS